MTSFEGFTLDYYKSVIENKALMTVIMNTIAVALISSGFATIIGLFGAIFLYLIRQKYVKSTLLTLNNVLIVSPDVIIGASLLILFSIFGIKLGSTSVILAHIAFSVPIVVLMILPSLYQQNSNLVLAAHDLGASAFHVVTKVLIPNIKPGIFAGFLMALTYSLDDFAVTFFVTGNGFSTLSVEIYAMARRGITLEINAISTVIFVVVLTISFIYYFVSDKKIKRGKTT
ncbi:ABC transporter permease [Phocicoccus pinnipedialis]|nr:ABC transporter permease [Jeotgalicoccus pinnipedialis]MBP1938999.1 spermidine/putrescine transport system permease protein [Jeotgalicoccus pinnipedialis]